MISAFPIAGTHHGSRDDRQPLRAPRPGFGLLRGKAQRHADQFLSRVGMEPEPSISLIDFAGARASGP